MIYFIFRRCLSVINWKYQKVYKKKDEPMKEKSVSITGVKSSRKIEKLIKCSKCDTVLFWINVFKWNVLTI